MLLPPKSVGIVANAPEHCQGATSIAAQSLRTRPLAVQNEGPSVVFVTCSFSTSGPITSVKIKASSIDGTARTISCTSVNGNADSEPSLFVDKTTTVTGSLRSLIWAPGDFGADETFPSQLSGYRSHLANRNYRCCHPARTAAFPSFHPVIAADRNTRCATFLNPSRSSRACC
jgi:hypothetical protein